MEEDKVKQQSGQYNRYLESMRKANKKYRENNKEYFNEYQKKYYQKHKDDENFVKMQREKALKYYYAKKLKKQMLIDNMEVKMDEIYVQKDILQIKDNLLQV
jgi:hypothetical protein